MTPVTVLVTGCGAPGTVGTLWSLEHNPDDREIRTVGVDVRSRQIGRYLCDACYTVPPATDDSFIDVLIDVCETEDVDVVLPQVTRELPVLAEHAGEFYDRNIAVAVSSAAAIERANDKKHVIDVCEDANIPAPTTTVVDTWPELESACRTLGYPDDPVVLKPPVSNGSRGLRILTESRDRKRAFYEEKPDGTYTTLDGLSPVLGEEFPSLLVMEHLPGTEYTVDVFSNHDRTAVIPRSRDVVRSGISFQGTTVEHEQLLEYSDTLASRLDLEYAFGFQFKEGADGTPKVLECNPRIQGTMVTSTLSGANLVYAAVLEALNEPVPSLDPEWGLEFCRYWGGIGVSNDSVVGNIGTVE